MRTGEIPSEWKSANITPVLKKRGKEEVQNYRPVSVLPIVAKVFERELFTGSSIYILGGKSAPTSRAVRFSSQSQYTGCAAKDNG